MSRHPRSERRGVFKSAQRVVRAACFLFKRNRPHDWLFRLTLVDAFDACFPTERRRDGATERWSDGATERWRDGATERWRDGATERWSDGEMERWRDEEMVRWRDGEMGRWRDGATER